MRDRYGTIIKVDLGETKILADIDFETYSPAGYILTDGKCLTPPHAPEKGLPLVGATRYAEHPKAEILCLAYNLKNGEGPKLWTPEYTQPPHDLFNFLDTGGVLEAWNAEFEYVIWNSICVKKYGFPPLSTFQLRCAAAKSRAFGFPSKLEKAGDAVNIENKKDKLGKYLINKFCIPRNFTKLKRQHRIYPNDDSEGMLLYDYCLRDIKAESELSALMPDLEYLEKNYWHLNHTINIRGVAIDLEMVESCICIIEQAHKKYSTELQAITHNKVQTVFQTKKMVSWISDQGTLISSLKKESVETFLSIPNLPPRIRRVLEIRQLLCSAAVKKLFRMRYQICDDGRLHGLFIYHSAHTGRAAGTGCQPQNLPKGGAPVFLCNTCKKHYRKSRLFYACPWCESVYASPVIEEVHVKWNSKAVNDALEVISTKSLDKVENVFVNAIDTVASCLRGLFVAPEGYRLISSDYSSIEAVVLAALAGEEWRLEVFKTHGKIYEMTASKISGIPFADFLLHKHTKGVHHPLRDTLGKVAELASGFGGWIGAWVKAGASQFFKSEEEIKQAILAWRRSNSAIVEFWGGQQRNYRKEYYDIEGAAISAVLSPGKSYCYRGISFVLKNHTLFCTLLSGRHIAYQNPELHESDRKPGTLSLTYEGWNSNIKNGKKGWMRIDTYGGKLAENIVQATARDILMYAMHLLEASGYPIVLHVHDEIVSEVKIGKGSLEEFERVMSCMPPWASNWPIKAKGGWEGRRYQK